MSTLSVGDLQGLAVNSNVVTVPTGHKLEVTDAGGLTAPGHILQVVNATHSVQHINSAVTYSATGLDATITPSSATSKVFVIITNPMVAYSEGVTRPKPGQVWLKLYRDASEIVDFHFFSFNVTDNSASQMNVITTLTYMDSPATTSAITYELYISSLDTLYSAYSCHNNKTASITLMEVSA
jgi:hypothetical protein